MALESYGFPGNTRSAPNGFCDVESVRMARPLRALLALVALGGGCATQTIDLLPSAGAAGRSGSNGGTRGGTPSSAGGRTTGGIGGSAARGGTGIIGGGAGGEGGDGAPSGCMTDLDCTDSRPHCAEILGTSQSHCVECVAHTNCPPGERCNFLTNQCAPACTTFDQCPWALPFCERGVCIQCQTDSHCGPNVCVFGHCEECRSTLDCPPSAPVCNESFVCRPCTGMFQCGQYRYCDLVTGRCEAF
jgi:hypothetical protein